MYARFLWICLNHPQTKCKMTSFVKCYFYDTVIGLLNTGGAKGASAPWHSLIEPFFSFEKACKPSFVFAFESIAFDLRTI